MILQSLKTISTDYFYFFPQQTALFQLFGSFEMNHHANEITEWETACFVFLICI